MGLVDGVGWADVAVKFDSGRPPTATQTDNLMLVVNEHRFAGGAEPCLWRCRAVIKPR